jgi:zinc protease
MSRRFGAVAVALTLLASAAASQAQTVTRQTTPAGLAFRHAHMPDDHFQVIAFAWKDGTSTVLPGKEALASLGTALIMEGPRGLTHSAMVEELRDLQATATLGAGVGVIQGHLTAPPEKLVAASRLIARTLADPELSADRLAAMSKSRAGTSRQSEGNAETLAARLLARLLIADGPHRRLAIGEPAMFERVTVADIEQWRKSVLVRDRLILVAVGPLDAADAGREIDRLFADLPQSGSVSALVAPVLRAPGKLVVLERAVVQTAIAVGGPLPVATTPDLVRIQLGVAALGGSSSARLWRAVRERLGAAYGISAGLNSIDPDTRALSIRAAVANDKAKDVLAAVGEEYGRFVTDGATDGEIDALKAIFVRNHRERLRRAPALAASLLTLALNDFPDDYLATYEQRLRGYARTAIADDVRATFPRQPLTSVVIAPSAAGFSADCVIKSPEEIARCE